MKKIGLIGGLSWESTAEYYRLLNRKIAVRTEGRHFAKLVIESLDFGDIYKAQKAGKKEKLYGWLTSAAVNLENSGAEIILICANTAHIYYDRVNDAVKAKVIHIAEETAKQIRVNNIRTAGLLGTIYTMEQDFYKNKLEVFNINTRVPEEEDRIIVNDIIFNELVHGMIKDESRQKLIEIIRKLKSKGAEGIILGCTELPLILKEGHSDLPLFDTTEIHAEAAVKMAME